MNWGFHGGAPEAIPGPFFVSSLFILKLYLLPVNPRIIYLPRRCIVSFCVVTLGAFAS